MTVKWASLKRPPPSCRFGLQHGWYSDERYLLIKKGGLFFYWHPGVLSFLYEGIHLGFMSYLWDDYKAHDWLLGRWCYRDSWLA